MGIAGKEPNGSLLSIFTRRTLALACAHLTGQSSPTFTSAHPPKPKLKTSLCNTGRGQYLSFGQSGKSTPC
ncbi:hypothetical protein CEXT_574901 [Caerostris extrusa]|uniref:Uncharacterized protein n=1 Tax=Caerostris extrusa TaxID=172846 RepID=A0AAV4Y6A6_CAEEX|nr:hypothetical protein CEXT_574901 [Caerostris extrusa]